MSCSIRCFLVTAQSQEISQPIRRRDVIAVILTISDLHWNNRPLPVFTDSCTWTLCIGASSCVLAETDSGVFTFLMLVSEITLSLMFAVVSFNPSPSASVEYLHPVCWFNINRFLWVCVQPWHPSALQRSHTVNLKALQEVCRETSRATFSISLFA